MMAVERHASEAVLGEAPEDFSITLLFLDLGGNFLAPTVGGCTSERALGSRSEPCFTARATSTAGEQASP